MRKIHFLPAALFAVLLTACDGRPAGESSGDEQLKEPVLNSGPQTEGQRAADAVSDSTKGNENQPDTLHDH